MKKRLTGWFLFVLVIVLVAGEKSNSKDDEDENYEMTNEVDDADDATNQVLRLINNAAMKIVDAPDLSKVILQISI